MKNENESFSPMIEPYLYSKLCIMLYDNTDVTNDSCIQCISELAELLPSTISRPNCLLIYINSINSIIEPTEGDYYLKEILQHTEINI